MSIYISEINFYSADGGDFVEVVAPAGTDMSGYTVYIYHNAGAVESGPFTLGAPANTIGAQDVYLIEQFVDGISISSADSIALVDSGGSVVQFLAYDGRTTTAIDGPIVGETSIEIGALIPNRTLKTTDEGATYISQSGDSRGTVPCFAAGTMVATAEGPKTVETLRPGDHVATITGTFAEIMWVHARETPLDSRTPSELPILIKAGALGPNRPETDLVISQNHRVVVGANMQLTTVFDQAALVPAKSLTGLRGVRMMHGRRRIVWYHFACARHNVVRVNGCAAESLLLGPMVLSGLDKDTLAAVLALPWTPETKGQALNGPPGLPCLTTQAVRSFLGGSKMAAAA